MSDYVTERGSAGRRICRTAEEIRAAGAAVAAAMPDMTEAEMRKVLALVAPYREQLLKLRGDES